MNMRTILNNTGAPAGGQVNEFLKLFPSTNSAPKKQQNAFIYDTKSGAFGRKANNQVQLKTYLEKYINTILQNKDIFGTLLDPTK